MFAVSEGTRVALGVFDEVVNAMCDVLSRREPSILHTHLLTHRSRQFIARTIMCTMRTASLTVFTIEHVFAARCVGGAIQCVYISMRGLTEYIRGIH